MSYPKKVYILHESGNDEHVRALKYWCDKRGIPRETYVYWWMWLVKKFLTELDFKALWWALRSIYFIYFRLLFKGKTVVLVTAPYEWKMTILERMLRGQRVIMWSSWTEWDSEAYFPRRLFHKTQVVQKAWQRFVNRLEQGVFVTPKARDSFLRAFPSYTGETEIVYHSMDPKKLRPIENALYKGEGLRAVYYGRYLSLKGLVPLIEAVKQSDIDLQLRFYGKGPELKRMEQAASGDGRIEVMGYLNGQQAVFDAFDDFKPHFLLLPAQRQSLERPWEELFGMVMIEAMGMGIVPVVTDHTGPKLIHSDGSGVVLKESEYFDRLIGVLKGFQEDPSEWQRKRALGFERAKEFTLDAIEQIWDGVLKELEY